MKKRLKQMDLTAFSAEEAAKTLYQEICKIAEENGQIPAEECRLISPETDVDEFPYTWGVAWENGPTTWPYLLINGMSMFNGEIGTGNFYYGTDRPEFLVDSDNWVAETHHGYDLGFSD